MSKKRNSKNKKNSPRQYNERRRKKEVANKSHNKSKSFGVKAPKQEEIEWLLRGIGTPDPTPFVPDKFQIDALNAIENQDVLVTAPTGSGKTWIAREEIRRLLEAGKKAWYTTPLKALTNSKFAEFREQFGKENVGILTGDRKENPRAPIIVGTTEIYRNLLFDALRSGEEIDTDFVILDEAHYLSDTYRGHVWEEAIILSPSRIRMLLLSATIGNASEFATWISEVRGTEVKIIDRAGSRPVELRAAFLSPSGLIYPLFDKNKQYNRAINRFGKQDKYRPPYKKRRR